MYPEVFILFSDASENSSFSTSGINFFATGAVNYDNYRVPRQIIKSIGINSVRLVMANNPKKRILSV